jgi:hypothetical protein
MNTYEMKWKPAGISWNYGVKTDIIKANYLEEAKKMIEAQAKMLGATGVEWYGQRQIG